MAEIISAVYKIINTITGDFYIGSSKNVKRRWRDHKKISLWDRCPNNPMYLDMKRYGLDYFVFEILAEVESEKLKEAEQQFIEILKPTYNNRRANGLDVERRKEYKKEYQKSEKCKEYNKEYKKSNKYKEYCKEYYQQNKEYKKEYWKEYQNQPCYYNGKTMTLDTLRKRFSKSGIENPTTEAKKYLVI